MTSAECTTTREPFVKPAAACPISPDLRNRLEEEAADLLAFADLAMSWWLELTAGETGVRSLDERDRRKIEFALGEIFERARRTSALLDPR